MHALNNSLLALKVTGARKEWNGKILFENVSFEIFQGEKVALIGKNGVGKTSLLRAIMGDTQLDAGSSRVIHGESQWGWLGQNVDAGAFDTLIDFVRGGHQELSSLFRRLHKLENALERSTMDSKADRDRDPNTASSMDPGMGLAPHSSPDITLLDQYAEAQDQYQVQGGYTWEIEVEACLTKLGLSKSEWTLPYSALSGGQKTRAQLARLMAGRPKALILDEPTNHLDAHTLEWLQAWLKEFSGTILFVTHDRALIDGVADAVLELTRDGCRRYKGGYGDYKAAKDLERKTQVALYERQERDKAALMEAISRYQSWYEKAHAAAGERNPFLKKRAMKNATRFKAKERALARLEDQSVGRPADDSGALIEFSAGVFEGHALVQLRDVMAAYSSRRVLSSVQLSVKRGDKIAILGPNGAGKTTLVRTVMGNLEENGGHAAGEIYRHPELKIGYFEQELNQHPTNETVLEAILRLPGMTESTARTILAGFLFRQEDVFKSIRDLSRGEQCRVKFVELYLSDANLLILDEPTNYLDIDTRERVEEALLEYTGALILVTHDSYFLRKVANRIAAIEDGQVSVFDGTYDEYCLAQAAPKYENRDVENRIRQLEIQLTELIGREEPDSPGAKKQLVDDIITARRELDALRASCTREISRGQSRR